MRLAIVGKGGVGKTTIAGTLARLLARRGHRVLALDLDPNPGLAWSIGIPPQDARLGEIVVEPPAPGRPPNAWRLVEGVDPAEALMRLSAPGPDGIRYLTPGKIDSVEFIDGNSMFGVREIVRAADAATWDIVTDIDAATATSCGRHIVFAEEVLVISTPSPTAQLTARRLHDLMFPKPITDVTSMSRGEPDPDGLHPLLRIPYDDGVREADRLGVPLVDHCPDSPTVAALDELATMLVDRDRARAAAPP